ncbi:hypothetical protein ACEN88_14325, partial [Massilia sp. CT11-108]|uniref:hypothetical protein n=1 Tax=Massilia sp. CT11-108 TaxID=3393900 RepID=UPI0039A57EF9
RRATFGCIHIGLSCTISDRYFCDAVLDATGQAPIRKSLAPAPRVDDLTNGVWWDARNGGRGNGVNINAILPVNPAPLVGMQSWFDTVCSVRKV